MISFESILNLLLVFIFFNFFLVDILFYFLILKKKRNQILDEYCKEGEKIQEFMYKKMKKIYIIHFLGFFIGTKMDIFELSSFPIVLIIFPICFVYWILEIIWINLDEILFLKEDIYILSIKEDKLVKNKIEINESLSINFTQKNFCQSCIGMMKKEKQIYISDGKNEITFGYFISEKECKEILEKIEKHKRKLKS